MKKESFVSPRPFNPCPTRKEVQSLPRQRRPSTARARKQEVVPQIAIAPVKKSSVKQNPTTSPRHATSPSRLPQSKLNGRRHLGPLSSQKSRRFQTPQTLVMSKASKTSESINHSVCRPLSKGKESSERHGPKNGQRDGRRTGKERSLHSPKGRVTSRGQKEVEESPRRARRSECNDTIPCPRSSRLTATDEGCDDNELVVEQDGKASINQGSAGATASSLGFRRPSTDRGATKGSSNADRVAAGQTLNVEGVGLASIRSTNVETRDRMKRRMLSFRFRPANT